ncbi:hypothetical protein P691DRAFT_676110, partial [Macrolepiota fuliginosa MF-IS2]
ITTSLLSSNMPRPNVIIFGASGSGKSSIVNMLSGTDRAEVSSGGEGCTFESRPYEVNILGRYMTLWDTAGLDEGDGGSVSNIDAVVQLYSLIRRLSDGVSLLMFVVRAPRIRSSVPRNWMLFRDIICQGKVPIVLVITGLELEENRNQWWCTNLEKFRQDGIYPHGHACITATRGKARGGRFIFDEEYEESASDLRKLMVSTVRVTPWHVPAAEWFKSTFIAMLVRNIFGIKLLGGALKQLIDVCKMPKADAKELAERLSDADVP